MPSHRHWPDCAWLSGLFVLVLLLSLSLLFYPYFVNLCLSMGYTRVCFSPRPRSIECFHDHEATVARSTVLYSLSVVAVSVLHCLCVNSHSEFSGIGCQLSCLFVSRLRSVVSVCEGSIALGTALTVVFGFRFRRCL